MKTPGGDERTAKASVEPTEPHAPYGDPLGCDRREPDGRDWRVAGGGDVKTPGGNERTAVLQGPPGIWEPLTHQSGQQSLADRLYAARPLAWRGAADLPQFPYPLPVQGLVMVLDLWSGVGGLLVALLALGIRCVVISAELDADLRQAKQAAFANLVAVSDVAELSPEMLAKVMRRRSFAAVLVGGGSPCQGNSSLNLRRKGLDDDRSWQPLHLKRLVEGITELHPGTPIYSFLENVASAPPDVVQKYTAIVGGGPVLVEAADWGWVERRRLYWLRGPAGGVDEWSEPALPEGLQLKWAGGQAAIKKIDGKVWPVWPHFEAGFQPAFDPKNVVNNLAKPLPAFTRQFFHPADRVGQVSAAAAGRFEQDGRRFPPHTYEERALLWNQARWRQPTPSERAALMGIPWPVVEPVGQAGPAGERAERQNSAIGNSFHVPSLMVALVLLFQLAEGAVATVPPQLADMAEKRLGERIKGTVFDEVYLQVHGGVLTTNQVMDDMFALLPSIAFPQAVMTTVREQMAQVGLASLQAFWAYLQLQGHTAADAPPTWSTQKRRGLAWAAVGKQRAAANSKYGLDHLLQPGLGKEEHIRQAKLLDSPYDVQMPMDTDIAFAVYALACWQQHLPSWRDHQEAKVKRIALILESLLPYIDKARVPSARAVASSRHVPLMAFMTGLLRWPDREQPKKYVDGFEILGDIALSHVFRPVKGIPVDAIDQEFFGEPAREAVEELLKTKAPKDADVIFAMTQDEIAKGYCKELMTAAQVNKHFGVGRWRPLHRFVIHQADGKMRLIDDGRRGRQNEWAALHETIYTISVDFVPGVAAVVADGVREASPGDDHEWADLLISTTDLPDAFRGLPIATADQRAAIVAIWHPRRAEWMFTTMDGCPFGLGVVVVHFNRYPTFVVAVARRILGLLVAAYFDDCIQAEPQAFAAAGGRVFTGLLGMFGTPPRPAKTHEMATHRAFLGAAVTMLRDGDALATVVAPKESTRKKLANDIQEAISTRILTPARAGKLRGQSGWLASNSFGRVGRLGQAVLKRLQYAEARRLTDEDAEALAFHLQIVLRVPPRHILLGTRPRKPLILYTDAEYSEGRLPKIGILLFRGAGLVAKGFAMELPARLVDTWAVRRQQIFPAETAAVPVALACLQAELRGRDVVLFVDNEAAVSALIRGASRASDAGQLAELVHAILVVLGCRLWVEWIDSISNPSDGLSREGVADPWTVAQGYELRQLSGDWLPPPVPDVFRWATEILHWGSRL